MGDSIRTVPTVNSLTPKQWLDEFQRLKKLNRGSC